VQNCANKRLQKWDRNCILAEAQSKKNKRRIAMGMPIEKKASNAWAIVGTIIAVLLCGCSGLAAIFWGALSAFISFFPSANINIGGSNNPDTAFIVGIGSLCGGILFIAIAIVIAIVVPILLRRKKKLAAPAVVDILPPQEPLPPAS
jgi:hypothetical protein